MARERNFPFAVMKLVTEAERYKDIEKYDLALDIIQRTITTFEFKESTDQYKKRKQYRRWVDGTKHYWEELQQRVLKAKVNLQMKLDLEQAGRDE